MATPTNVSELYTSIGMALPSVKDRTANATKAGISNFAGTSEQNQQYFSYYSKNPESLRISTPEIPQLTATSTPKPIALESLGVKQPAIPTQPVIPEIQSSQNFAQGLLDSVATQETALQKEASGLSSKIYNLIPELGGQTEALNKAQEAAGVSGIKTNLNTINNEINFKMAELSKDDVSLAKSLQDIEDKPVAMEFITGEQASVQRNAQIARAWKNAEINTLNARALAVRGDLELAIDTAQQAVESKYQPIKDTIDLYQKQLDSLKPRLDAEEIKIASEKQLKIDLALQDWKDKKDNEKEIQSLITKAAGQGADQSILKRASSAKTPQEAAIALGQWAGDYWQTQQIKQAIEISKANLSKIYAETAQTTAETANKFTNVAGGIVAGYNIGKYATDPTHESSVAKLYSNLSSYNFNDSTSIDKAIKNASSTSPITGQMILNASKQFGVDPKMVFAMMQQDSSLGTAGMGARNNNPGNIAQFDHLNKPVKGYATLQDGVNAVAQWLGKNKAPESVAVLNLKEKYNELNTLSNSEYLSNAVGPNSLARSDFSSWYTGGKQNFLGTAQNLLSKETLDALINAKAGGATFGALSDAELKMLHTAATKLNQWAMRDDKGNVTGFNIDEPSFKSELDNVKKLTKAAIERAGGSTIDLADSGVLNDYYSSVNNSILTAASTQAYGGYKY